ncbi:MAG: glucosaminidase domain-containing protein [Saprospiraceae bacterium]|nr:glucosaminidase domain-containing protein [Saprospiraceae bacterium]
MKEFDLTNGQANNTDANSLRVVFKKHNTMEDLTRFDGSSAQRSESMETFGEMVQRIVKGWQRLLAALENRGDYFTFGMITKIGGRVLLKVCILGIIMLLIVSDSFDFNLGKPIFASANNSREKTHQDKHVQKKDYNTTSASLGSGVSFDLSPASPEELREQSVKSYIERFSKVAVAEMDQFGIPASISMAQAIVESRSGTSVLAARNNNHFGIKCFSKSCPKGHCANFTDDHHKDFFRKYANPSESWREHSQFLMKYRYRSLLKYGKNYKVWARGLREFGYATDQNYDKKLIAIIERYELNKLDDL